MTYFARLLAIVSLAAFLTPGLVFAESDCTDGIDNDGDFLIDCLDDSCNAQACDDGVSCTVGETCTFATTSCGGGTPTDAICDNGQFCDGAETCDAVLDCQAGTPPTIDDGVGCTTDVCDEFNDIVTHTPNNAVCDNGAFCDGAEICDPVLDCQAGTPPTIDDGVGCTDDSCDEVNDVVVNAVNNASCNDGQFCNGVETCDAVLDCQAGTAPSTDDGVGCTDDSCDEVNDVIVNAVNNANCDNGQFCDGAETCDAVLDCQAGTAPSTDDGIGCTDDSCDEVNDVIVNAVNNANCDNGQFCDGAETCDAVLDCQAGTAPSTDDGIGCTDDSCDEVNDVIINAVNNANCDNGQFCDGAETCDAVLDCQAGTPPSTDDGVGCTDDSCDEVNDVIVNAVNDTNCDNGQFCDGAETCDAVLDCQAGTPPSTDDGVGCTDDSCDEVNDVIVNAVNDTNCDNGQFCDGAETCDAVLDCQAGTAPSTDDGVGCTDDSCDEVNDVIVNAVNDTNCDNGQFCDGSETCDAVLDCQAGTAPSTDDGVGCTDDSCDEVNDVIVNAVNDTNCDNGQFCDGSETCDAVLDCQAGTAPSTDDGVGCTDDSCDEVNDVIVNAVNNANCDNGQFCDGAETCDAALDCQAGTPPTTDDGVGCTDDSCDEVNDVIVNAVNDANCDNGQFCDGAETCDPVIDCQGGAPPVIDDGISCTDDSCDEVNDVVVNAVNNGNCDDGQFCNGVETCDAVGDCQAGTPPSIDDGVTCTDDFCDEANDVIVNTANNANCNDGQFCNGVETCDALLDCQAGTPPVIDDGVGCTQDSCDEVNDVVVRTPDDSVCDDGIPCTVDGCDLVLDCQNIPDNSQCSDSDACNGGEQCIVGIGCADGPPVSCDDGVACTADVCDPVTGNCSNVPNDQVCSDGVLCNGLEICDPAGGCGPGVAPPCDDGVTCTQDTCDAILNECIHVPVDALCDDSLYCTGTETCDPVEDCQAGVSPCDDGIDCTIEVCDEGTQACTPTPDDTLCDNGQFCDGFETCNAGVGCQPGPSVDCSGTTVGCWVGFCDEVTDACSAEPKNLICQDDEYCNGIEICNPDGSCSPGTGIDCSPLDSVCGTGFCNETLEMCDVLPMNEGGACDDGDACSGGEICESGICTGQTGGSCGDGVVDASCGEECDPPSTELCNSSADLDNDGLIACLDPDCCNAVTTTCGAECRLVNPCLTIFDAPGRIKIGGTAQGKLKLRGKVRLNNGSDVNPLEEGFGVILTDTNGRVYEATLGAGDLLERSSTPRRYIFKDRNAKDPNTSARNGLSRVRINIDEKQNPPVYSYSVNAFANLTSADLSPFTVQVFGVSDTAIISAPWRKSARGWNLTKQASNSVILTTCN